MDNKEAFSYTYSAKQQEEIKKIREKYVPEEADKMERLRKLDRGVTQKSTAISSCAPMSVMTRLIPAPITIAPLAPKT